MYAKGDRLYRVVQVYLQDNGTSGRGIWMPAPLAKVIAKGFSAGGADGADHAGGFVLWRGEQ